MDATSRILIGWVALGLAGCDAGGGRPPHLGKAPRPVSVTTLQRWYPAHGQTMTGSVGAWKTEEVGFEVAGRVLAVLEPSTEIEGRILDSASNTVLNQGTVLARLDDERYRIAAGAAEAAVEVAIRKSEAVQVDIEQGIPARITSAELERDLAALEFKRANRLSAESAISQGNLDQTRTTLGTATANVSIRQAELAVKEAELRSVAAQIQQAEQQLAEAERDQRDTTLYSSFRGQVAQVHVVPGSYVAAGQPVLTIQMMDPIKVELELSAAMSRKFRYGDTVRLYGNGGDNEPIPLTGFVYMTDPVADPHTRTFTVTLLVRNQKVPPWIPADLTEQQFARTNEIWPLNVEPIVGGGVAFLVEARAIQHDAEGAFLWKVMNRHIGDVSTEACRILDVTKVRVIPGQRTVPFLGMWDFIPITVLEGEKLDPDRDMVAGEIFVGEAAAPSWCGDRVLLDRSGWLLRPGDLVRVDLRNGKGRPGYYVPTRTICHELDRTFVFLVDESSPGSPRARKVEVTLTDSAETDRGEKLMRRIEPIGVDSFRDGTRLIVEGAHFLVDGEVIAVVETTELLR